MHLRDPFTANSQVLQAETGMQEDLTELQHDDGACDMYSAKKWNDFWFLMRNSYRRIAEPAISELLLFPSKRICESTFLVLLGITSKFMLQLKTPDNAMLTFCSY